MVLWKGSTVTLWLAIINIKNIILINSYLDLCIRLNSSEFKLEQFWMSYLQMVELLLSTIYSVRLGKWDLSTNVNAVHRWEINAGYRADLRRCFHEHINYKSQLYKHKDLSPSRIQNDESDVSSVIAVLTETFIPPVSETNLLSISTGIEVPVSTANDITGAEKKGEELMATFIEERLKDNPTKTIFDPINKTKLGSFSSLHKSTTCKVKDKVVSLKSGKKLLQGLRLLLKKDR